MQRQRVNVSFCGCGFLGVYHVGVAVCLREHAHLLEIDKVAGASAGALTGASLLCGVDFSEVILDVFELAARARGGWLGPFSPAFDIVSQLRGGLRKYLPADAHISCSGRLHISLTRVSDAVNIVVSDFPTKEDLIQALICTSFVPFFSGLVPPLYHGRRYWDGGISDNLPIFDSNTITVSPFSGESDIRPGDTTSSFVDVHVVNQSFRWTSSNFSRLSHALFPPTPEGMKTLCKEGYGDAVRFLRMYTSTEFIRAQAPADLDSSLNSADSFVERYTDLCDSDMPIMPIDAAQSDTVITVSSDAVVAPPPTPTISLIDMPAFVSNALHEACITDFLRESIAHHDGRAPLLPIPWTLPLEISYAISVKLLRLLSIPGGAVLRSGRSAVERRAAFRAIMSVKSSLQVTLDSLLLEATDDSADVATSESAWKRSRRRFLREIYLQLRNRSRLYHSAQHAALSKAATIAVDLSTKVPAIPASAFRRTDSVPTIIDDDLPMLIDPTECDGDTWLSLEASSRPSSAESAAGEDAITPVSADHSPARFNDVSSSGVSEEASAMRIVELLEHQVDEYCSDLAMPK